MNGALMLVDWIGQWIAMERLTSIKRGNGETTSIKGKRNKGTCTFKALSMVFNQWY